MARRVTRQLRFDFTPGQKYGGPPSESNEDASRTQCDVQPNPDIAPTTTTVTSVQETSNCIQVFLRIRPFNQDEKDRNVSSCILSVNDGKLQLRPNLAIKHPPRIRAANKAVFRFSHIFNEESTQASVFERTSLPLIGGLFNGQSAVIFAYGVTCSGKTYTIQGSPQCPGILPRSLDVIINSISMAKGFGLAQDVSVSESVGELTDDQRHRRRLRHRVFDAPKHPEHDANYIPVDPNVEYDIYASYLEVYNDQVYDLFDRNSIAPGQEESCTESQEVSEVDESLIRPRRRALRLKERLIPGNSNIPDVYVEGQTEVRIRSVADIDRLVEFGCNNRSVAHTASNASSSRSHAIFIIILRQTRTITDSSGKTIVSHQESKLNIVDLAGSEKVSKSGNSTRVVESRKINTSLMTLSRCFEMMRYNQTIANNAKYAMCPPRIVPFRDSKLTRLLHRSLSVGAAVMIAAVSPSMEDADESIHALCSTAIAREVKLKPSPAPSLFQDIKKNREKKVQGGSLAKQSKRALVPTSKPPSARKRHIDRALRPKIDDENTNGGDVSSRELRELKRSYELLQDQLDISLDELKQKTDHLSRFEEALKISEEARSNSDEVSEKLFRENERLRDRLAHVEAKLQLTKVELVEEMRHQVTQIISNLRGAYEDEILRLRRERDDAIGSSFDAVDDHCVVSAERVTRKLARTSCAALENIRQDIQAMDEEDAAQRFMSDGEFSEDSIEYEE